jgi:acyl-CoA reductase-like NAD-dependent aldehyde dehydrogenase
MPVQFAGQLPGLAADWLRYHAGWADKRGGEVIDSWPARSLDYTLDEPYGVVAGIIPWNGALMSAVQLWGPALATGNAVVTKPSELAPFVAARLADLAVEAGIPAGVVTVVPGAAPAGQALASHPDIDKIFFTGGAATAKHVLGAASAQLTPVALELGGKSPHLVFADADLRITARQAMSGIVALSGQGCANGTRLLVQESIAERLLEILLGRLRHAPAGDPADERTMVGPVVSQASCDRIMEMIDRGRDRGRLLAGGSRAGGELAQGFFIEPTVFTDLDGDHELIREEIFGPVLTVQTFTDEAEAIALANSGRHDLAAYIHTNDLRRAHRVSRALAAGAIWINGIPGLRPSTPFGGGKRSGTGRIGGAAGIREFLRPKNVWLSL